MIRIEKSKFGYSVLEIKADFGQASSQISYRLDSEEDWEITPFQVADFRHSVPDAIKGVKGWLRQDGANV